MAEQWGFQRARPSASNKNAYGTRPSIVLSAGCRNLLSGSVIEPVFAEFGIYLRSFRCTVGVCGESGEAVLGCTRCDGPLRGHGPEFADGSAIAGDDEVIPGRQRVHHRGATVA
ncbi:MAG: hypothetical protein J2P18_08315 [Nocardia sp.]|nr:hypothetical protein [Nocardia sp.]